VVKADTVGSLEALVYELSRINIPIKKAEVGPVSKRDFTDAKTNNKIENRIIVAFNVPVMVREEGVEVLEGNIIYGIKDEIIKVINDLKQRELQEKRKHITFPVKIQVLPDRIFRISKPAIFGVRVIAGTLRVKTPMMRSDGKDLGIIKSMRNVDQSLEEAKQGEEIAVAMDDVTVGRQIKENDILYSNLNENDAKALQGEELTLDEKMVLDEIINIKRKEKPFWGT